MSVGEALAHELKERGALLEGHFKLSSGRHSDRFVQKFRILEEPQLVERVAAEIAAVFRKERPTVVVSAAVGGIILGYEVARALGVRAIFVEKERGVPVLRRDFQLGSDDRALVVEDVVTTGGSVMEVLEIVRSRGAAIIGLGVIVLRTEVEFGVPTTVVLRLPLSSYAEDECPQCARSQPLADPGSRRSA